MICGALQTLNEEACEDVLEETEDKNNILTDMEIPHTSVIPPSPDTNQGESQASNVVYKSCLGNTTLSGTDKSYKKVTIVDVEGSDTVTYVEPTITILEPQSINASSVQSVKYTLSSSESKIIGDGDVV